MKNYYECIAFFKRIKSNLKTVIPAEERAEFAECADAAISAMEKQTEKDVTDCHIYGYYCPACGTENITRYKKTEDKYCPECGQKLNN